jgi:hypothetical protein
MSAVTLYTEQLEAACLLLGLDRAAFERTRTILIEPAAVVITSFELDPDGHIVWRDGVLALEVRTVPVVGAVTRLPDPG